MLKIYLYKKEEHSLDSFLINLFLTGEVEFGPLFQRVQTAPFKSLVQFTTDPHEVAYMILPHTYFQVKDATGNYEKEAQEFARLNNLKTIIFAYGDNHDDIGFDNALILRTARYKSTLKENEIILPPFIEDLGQRYGIEYLSKKELPIVGFAGMTYLPTTSAEVKYQMRLAMARLQECVGTGKVFQRQGLYFRRQALDILARSTSCELQAQKRTSFSASKSTIQGDPKVVRQEFVDSIKRSHLPLIIRGDGNYSLRFFEALSLGRVPLFIDTDTPLPLEGEIDYDSFMLRVNYKDIQKLPEIIEAFWHATSEEAFLAMQKRAREVFETKLRTDVFYKDLFEKLEKNEKYNL